MKPDSSTRDLYAAWDKSRGIGGGLESKEYDPSSARVQAAFGFLFDTNDIVTAAAAPAPAAPPSPRNPPQAPRGRAGPLFRRSSSPIIMESPAKKRKREAKAARAPSAPSQEVLELDSGSEDEAPHKDKGKERAVTPQADIINLVDSDDDDAPMFVAPPLAEQAPQPPVDPIRDALAGILAAIPDVLPSYVEELLHAGETADAIVDKLLGEGGRYPKAEGVKVPVKRGWAEAEEKKEEPSIDYMDIKKRDLPTDMHYRKRALDQLYLDFNEYATADIKREFKSAEVQFCYAPAWYKIRQLKRDHKLTKISKARKVKTAVEVVDVPAFDAEMDWLAARVQKEKAERKQKRREEQAVKEEEERKTALDEQAEREGTAVECQCCFGNYHSDNTTECSGHCRFCTSCALGNAMERLGKRLHALPCLADCGSFFSDFEARRFLPRATLELMYRIQAEKELDEAGLEGLEKCPFCPYAAVVDNPDERLFHCEREGCGKTSCRKCKEIGHVPLSCDEAKKEKKLPGLHQVEEAMSQAMIRRCPKCKTPCIKSDGCNVMTCTICTRLEFCYICQAVAGHGSNHYGGVGAGGGKCPQFDDTEKRTFEEVEAARQRALAALDEEDAALLRADADKIAAQAPHRPPAAAAAPRYPAAHLPQYDFPQGYGAAYLQQLQQWAMGAFGGYGGGYGGLGAGGGAVNPNVGGYGQVPGGYPVLRPPAPVPQVRGNVVGGAAAPLTAAQRRARAAEAAARRADG